MTTLLILPILIPFLTGTIAYLVNIPEMVADSMRKKQVNPDKSKYLGVPYRWRAFVLWLADYCCPIQRALSLIGGIALFIASSFLLAATWDGTIYAVQMGGWDAPYGITLVADTLSGIMVCITGLMGLFTILFSLVTINDTYQRHDYHPLLHILLMGVCGAFLTGDLFNMYVWYEVMLISSFVLLALGGRKQQLQGAIKYVTMNLIASVFFLAAVGMIYGLVGSLNMADVARRIPMLEDQGAVTAIAMLFLVAFGIKSAMFPFFSWLPESYHTPPITVTVIFSALLTKVGVYSLIRVFTLVFVHDTDITHTAILWLSGFTMVTGVLGAVAQMEVRRLLSFHIISQIGYLLMGLGLSAAPNREAATLALAGTVFFLVHVILSKSGLFLISGVLARVSGTYDLEVLGGFYRAMPLLSAFFLISALSLAGIPPLSGFWAKFALVRAGLEAEYYVIIGVALAVGMLTLFSMIKIWSEAFWKNPPSGRIPTHEQIQGALTPMEVRLALLFPIAAIAALMIILGVLVEPLFGLSHQAAEQLLTRDGYIQTVLGTSPMGWGE